MLWLNTLIHVTNTSTEKSESRKSRNTHLQTDQVMSEGLLVLHVFEAVLADPQFGLFSIILRERREVPGVDLKVSNLDLVHILDFGDLRNMK